MGLLINGEWRDQWYDTKKSDGKFIRQDSKFRDYIGSHSFPAEPNRYHLYISNACPWAHRTAIFRELKQLQDIITISAVNSYMGENGWYFDHDPINNKKFLYEIYLLADPNYTGRVTVPILWDKKTKTIVNNESAEIIRMLNSAFNDISGNFDDYYPSELQNEIDQINEFIYHKINNGVYKAGFATKQSVYETEVHSLFNALNDIEIRLTNQKFLLGYKLTEADIRLFTTLVRFDPVYVGHFKCNLKRIKDYPYLSRFLKTIINIKNVEQTINYTEIKEHYYKSHPTINPNGIVPVGPMID
ncbi:glutathione S-transferase family protein [Rickettsiales bacterium]|nr:glutathione S-transferase family protein [Rickettsiales bacterium]